jgi:hypothetical protein
MAIAEGFVPFVDLLAKPADLAFANAAHAHGLDAIVDQAGRDPLHMGLLDAGGALLTAIRRGSRKAGK